MVIDEDDDLDVVIPSIAPTIGSPRKPAALPSYGLRARCGGLMLRRSAHRPRTVLSSSLVHTFGRCAYVFACVCVRACVRETRFRPIRKKSKVELEPEAHEHKAGAAPAPAPTAAAALPSAPATKAHAVVSSPTRPLPKAPLEAKSPAAPTEPAAAAAAAKNTCVTQHARV